MLNGRPHFSTVAGGRLFYQAGVAPVAGKVDHWCVEGAVAEQRYFEYKKKIELRTHTRASTSCLIVPNHR
jgi:hypothetical protein